MSKPRILILMHYLELGGAEMALIGLLQALDPHKVDVDLFIYSHQGALMKHIPNWVNLLPEHPAYSVIERPMKEAALKCQIGVLIGRLLAKYKHWKKDKGQSHASDDISMMQYVGDNVTPWLPRINSSVEYDLCISFLIPHNIGKDKVNAKKRIAWIHTDYSTVSLNPEQELPVWEAYDNIVSISDDVSKSFTDKFPSLKDKIILIENILSSDFVRKRAKQINVKNELNGSINLLSVGRYTAAKNYDNVPIICKILRDTGADVKWYIIGYGSDETLIRQRIMDAGMEEHVILLGKKDNPYPYIDACDIYVQPSRYEGKSVTVREAQILYKPVVVTNYKTASSQINDREDGIIVPMDNDGCAKGTSKLIKDRELQNKLRRNLIKGDFANKSEVNKIYSLLGIN